MKCREFLRINKIYSTAVTLPQVSYASVSKHKARNMMLYKTPTLTYQQACLIPKVLLSSTIKDVFLSASLRWLAFLFFVLNISPMPNIMYQGNVVNGSVFGPAFLSISVRQFHEILSVKLQAGIFEILRPPRSDSSSVGIPAPYFLTQYEFISFSHSKTLQ